MRSLNFILSILAIISTLFFCCIFMLNQANEWWAECYFIAIMLAVVFVWLSRANLFTLGPMFITIYLVAIIFPAVPYLIFDLEMRSSFRESIFLNSLGLLSYLSVTYFLSPMLPIRVVAVDYLRNKEWGDFFKINHNMFLLTLPIVLFVITLSGGWGVYTSGFNNDTSGFNRMSSLQGMGGLMLFSFMNVYSGIFYSVGLWVKNKKMKAFLIALLFICLNGFTGGRGDIIALFMIILLLYGIRRKLAWRMLFFVFVCGLGIVLLKQLRFGDAGVDNRPWQLLFFLQFVGDFDSLNNDAALIEYVHNHGYVGLYHIWSSILIYIPRFLFVNKPYDLGGLYLDTLVFPGVYRGAQGGTGLSFGVAGLFYAVFGTISLVIGCGLIAYLVSWYDRKLFYSTKNFIPSKFFIRYVMLMASLIILYREGLYAFIIMMFYSTLYFIFYAVIAYYEAKSCK